MKKIAKKASLALALVTCASLAVPVLGQTGVMAATQASSLPEQYTITSDYVQIEGFKTTGTVGNEYEFVQPTNYGGVAGTIVVITVKDPYGASVSVSNYKFTPQHAGIYTATYSVKNGDGVVIASSDYKITVKDLNEEYTLTTPANSERVVPATVPTKLSGSATVVQFPAPSEITIKDADGNIVDDENLAVTVTMTASDDVEYAWDAANQKLTVAEDNNVTYTAKYELKKGDKLVAYTTISTTAKTMTDFEAPKYTYSYSSSQPETAEIGVETVLPSVVATAKSDASAVNVHYSVTVKQNGTDISDKVLKVNDDGNYVFTPDREGNFEVTYTIKDFYGNAPSVDSTSFTISDVTDKTAPTPMVTLPYTTTGDSKITDDTAVDAIEAFSEVQTGNILILPIYATDNANGYVDNNLTLYRQIVKSDDTVVYTEENNQYSQKALVFNGAASERTVYVNGVAKTIAVADQQAISDITLAEGSYTVKYIAKDKLSGKSEVTLSVPLKVVGTFSPSDEAKPTVAFSTSSTLPDNMSAGETTTFKAPTATQAQVGDYTHTNLSTYIEYQLYDGSTWTDAVRYDTAQNSWITINEEETEYTLEIPEGTEYTAIKVIAKSMNDLGKVGSVEKTIQIVGTGDTGLTEVYSYEESDEENTYVTGDKLYLPTITYSDTQTENVAIDVVITYSDGTNYTAQDFEVAYEDLIGGGFVTYSNGYFIPEQAGTYSVTYTSIDAGYNMTLFAFNVTIADNPDTVTYGIANLPSAINGGEAELNEKVKLPSVEPYVSSDTYLSVEKLYISVKGATGYQKNGTSYLTFTKEGTYKVQYVAQYKVLQDFQDYEADDIITYTSTEYTIEVKASTSPKLTADSATKLSNVFDTWKANGGLDKNTTVTIGEGKDIPLPETKSELNLEKSKVVITSPNSSTVSYTFSAEDLEKLANGVTLSKDDVYSFTFTLVDVNGNSTTLDAYTVDVGKVEAPTLKVADGAVKSSYKLGDLIFVDMSKITATDVNTAGEEVNLITKSDDKYKIADNNTITITIKNKTTSETFTSTVSYDAKDLVFQFKDMTAGEYVLNVEVTGDTNKTATDTSITFTVSEDSSTPLSGEEILGIVLIVVSVIVLGGVITYFVVTRKKYKNR